MADKIVMILIYAVFCAGIMMIFLCGSVRTESIRSGDDIRALGRTRAGIGIRRADIKGVLIERCRGAAEKVGSAELLRSLKKENIDREIYESLSYMRNLIIAHRGAVNSDAVISGLAERDGILKSSYIKMLSLMRTGRVREAEAVMCEKTGTEAGKEFASVLTSWEYMNPEQLSQIIVSQRKSIRENCITKQKKRDEMISNLIYFPATANIFLIFINFIYISYFMQQKEMLEMMF